MLAWDALAVSLHDLAVRVNDAEAGLLRAEAARIRRRIAELAPDHWSVKSDIALRIALFRLDEFRGSRVLDSNDIDPISTLIVDEDHEHPTPRTEDVSESLPSASQFFPAFRESRQLTQSAPNPRARIAG